MQNPLWLCGSTELHTKQFLPCGPHSLDRETDISMDTFQFIVIRAKERCGNCVGARAGSSPLAWESPGCFLEKVHLSCREGWEKVAILGRAWARKVTKEDYQPENQAVFAGNDSPLWLRQTEMFSSVLIAGCRILRFCGIGSGRRLKRKEVGVSWASLQNFL